MNFFSEEYRRNPYPVYEQLRSASPVLNVPALNLWMLFDYDGVKQALNDPANFSSNLTHATGRPTPQWMIFFDPPRHTKLRALILSAFTPRVIAGLEPRIRQLSRELLDAQVGRGGMDLAADYSVQLPILVIAEMLGIPLEDRATFKRWSDVILELSFSVSGGPQAAAASQAYFAARDEMNAYLEAMLRQRRASPAPDLLTRLAEAEVDGERLTDAEIRGFFELLLVAATETTTNLINNTMLCLFENPEQRARVEADGGLLPSCIEEALRYRSPFQWALRGTRQDVEIHGQTIPAGKLVLAVMGSANRDPRVFPDAARFEIARDPNPHIAFGYGSHFCLGAALSRLEGKIAVGDILGRLKNVRREGDTPWQPRAALHVHGPTSLPVVFD